MQGISPDGSDEQNTPPESSSTVVFMAIADTTWRMFVPSIGFTLLGVWLDNKLQTAPWLLFLGIIVGLSVAAWAVKIQLKKFW